MRPFCLSFLTLATACVSAQTVHKHFGLAGANDAPQDMCLLPSGNIIALGWTYEDSTLQFIKLNGQTGDVMLFRSIAKTGSIMSNVFGFRLHYTATGKVLAVGNFQDPQPNYAAHPPTILMFDTSGTLLLSKGVGNTYWDEVGATCTEVASGKYAFTTHDGGPQDDSSGTCLLLFDETWTATDGRCFKLVQDFGVPAMAALPDQSLVLAGGCHWPFNVQFDGESVILKVDAGLDPVWAKTYIGPDTRAISNIANTPDGGFLTLAWADDTATTVFDMLLMKVNGTGSVQWAKRYSNPDKRLFIRDFVVNPDGSVLMAATYLHSAASNYDAVIIKTDSTGNILWAQNYGDSVGATAYFEGPVSVAEVTGGFVFMGNTNKPGHTDYMFGRTDVAGFAGCYQSMPSISVEDVTSDIRDSFIVVNDSVATKTFYDFAGFSHTDVTVPSGELCSVGIDNVNQPQVRITPNPADEYVLIRAEYPDAELSVVNLSGQVVRSALMINKQLKLWLEDLTPGLYLVRLRGEFGTQTAKLVVR